MSTTQTGTKKGNNVFGDVNFNNDALYISSSGNVGIGTTTPTEKLTVQGNISGSGNLNIDGAVTASTAQLTNIVNAGTDTDKFLVLDSSNNVDFRTGAQVLSDIGGQASLTNPVTGTGTTNYLPKFTGTSTLGDSLIYDNGTNVGIGTTSPNSKLHVQGSRIIVQDAPTTSGVIRPSFQDIQNSSELLRLYTVSGQGNGYISNPNGPLILGASAQTASLAISTAGNVGIGTTSPSARLDVNGNMVVGAGNKSIGSWPFYISDSSNLGWKVSDSSGTAKFELYVGNGGINQMRLLGGVSIVGFSQDLSLGTSAYLNTVNISNTNGNVGIGTTTPNSKLDVNGNTTITGSLAVSQSLLQYSNITSVTSGSTSNVASFNTSSYTAAFFDYVTTSGTSARAGTVFTVWNGNNVEYTETSTNDIGNTNNLVLSASLSAGAIRLQATSLSGSWSVKTLARMI